MPARGSGGGRAASAAEPAGGAHVDAALVRGSQQLVGLLAAGDLALNLPAGVVVERHGPGYRPVCHQQAVAGLVAG